MATPTTSELPAPASWAPAAAGFKVRLLVPPPSRNCAPPAPHGARLAAVNVPPELEPRYQSPPRKPAMSGATVKVAPLSRVSTPARVPTIVSPS